MAKRLDAKLGLQVEELRRRRCKNDYDDGAGQLAPKILGPEPNHERRRYRRRTYRELSNDVEAVAVGLRDIGIAERTRTVFMAPPSYDASVAALALTRVGATTVWIDPTVGYLNVAERLRRLDSLGMLVRETPVETDRFRRDW